MHKSPPTGTAFAMALFSLFVSLHICANPVTQKRRIVVTTSLLECGVNDLTDDQNGWAVTRLIPPGNCPGHFDISPKAASRLKASGVLIRHDYQKSLTKKIENFGGEDLNIVTVKTPGSFLIPANYLKLLRQLRTGVADHFPGSRPMLKENFQRQRQHLQKLDKELQQRTASWKGTPVIAAKHQKQFVRYLGFEPVGILPRPSDTTAKSLKALMDKDPALIIGNRQSNADAARNLAARMDVPVAIVSNFPGVGDETLDYTTLLQQNLKSIRDAWNKN